MKSSAESLRLPLLAIVVGVIVAVAGIGLLKLIWLITNLCFHGRASAHEAVPDFTTFGAWAILVPAAGGLFIGWIARFVCPEVRGHGIPEAMQGVMTGQSRIPLKVALLKPLSTAVSIGTGGPFGAEGPIIATGGAVGSLLGQAIPCSTSERKILLAAGATAGMAAVFGTPLAAVLLSLELLLFEFRSRSLIPVALAAGAAMAVRACFGEPFPMLPLASGEPPGPMLSIASVAVGIAAGIAAVLLTHALHGIEHLYEKLPIPWMWWPALGGLAVGVIGWVDPRTLGPGYENLRSLLSGEMALSAIAALALFKFLSWTLCLGSGTAGGTLAPVMTLGGVTGALVAHGLHLIPGVETVPIGMAALVGMAAIFAGVSRAFLASVAFGFEATHSTSSFGPLLIGCALAVLVSRIAMRETMMTEKLARRGVRVPADYEPDALLGISVADVMLREPLTISPTTSVTDLAARMIGKEDRWNAARLIPITDESGHLLGIISRADVLAAVQAAPDASVLDAGIESPVVIHPDESLAEAADRMILHGVGRLPVVERGDTPRLVGLVSRREVLLARKHRLDAERR
ncbi:chloride channel protein [Luteolibacter flavescens]|uniref:Chloride channel protein n=1 Tax=Luteolibacter flavescens TaxID=1859460 RepID=A0ABT3FIX8_9BACT|nr:chloride channel protein [Luteolibacter flavescens]MCW1883513.1 chloride channel protein [Luteolibacter flavescens]